MKRRSWFGFLTSIRGQLVLGFLLISLVPLAVVLWVAYDTAADGIERLALDRLASVARERAKTIERIADDRVRGLDAVVRAPGFIAACRDCSKAFREDGTHDAAALRAANARAHSFLQAFADAHGYVEIVLLSPAGRLLFSAERPDAPGTSLADPDWKTSALSSSFANVMLLLQPEITPPHMPRGDGRSDLWVVGPLLDGNTLVGIVAGELARDEFESVLSDRTGLGTTGEVLAGTEMGSGRFVLTGPTRDDPKAAFRTQVRATDPLGARFSAAARGNADRGRAIGANAAEVIAAGALAPSLRWSISAEQDVSEAFAPLARLRDAAFITVVAVVLNVIAIALVLARRIALPLQQAVSGTRRIAAGDLTQPVVVQGRGETRDLLDAVRTTSEDLSKLIGRIQSSSSQILASSSSVRTVAAGQNEVARDFGASSSQIAAATNQMNATARELAATVTELARTAAQAAVAAGAGRGSLSSLSGSMERLNTGAGVVSQRFTTVSMKAAQIDAVVGAITKVANQTNLLAVNAAIEAEKAGEAGLGFQVVAREIDRLATQAATSALEIESTIASMQEAVAEGVRELGQFGRTVEDGCTTARGASDQLSQVLRQVEELQASFEQVELAVRSQSEGVSQVNEAMSMLVRGAKRTSDGSAASTKASEALDSAAKTLESEVSRFRIS